MSILAATLLIFSILINGLAYGSSSGATDFGANVNQILENVESLPRTTSATKPPTAVSGTPTSSVPQTPASVTATPVTQGTQTQPATQITKTPPAPVNSTTQTTITQKPTIAVPPPPPITVPPPSNVNAVKKEESPKVPAAKIPPRYPRKVAEGQTPTLNEVTPLGVVPMPRPEPKHPLKHLEERRMRRAGGLRPIIKLEPRIKVMEIEADPYPMELFRPFILDGLIVDYHDDLDGTPYLVGLQDSHAVVGQGYFIYARGLCEVEQKHYAILGQGKSYFHPVTKECLGYHAPIIGKAELTILGPVSQLRVIDAVEVVERKNLLVPTYCLPPVADLKAKPATTPIEGIILDVKEDWGDIGKNNNIIMSIGYREGLREGEYLDIYRVTERGAICIGCPPKLPDLKIGRVLVFRVYEKLSLGLIVEAIERIDLLDRVRAPMDCNPRPGIAIFE